MIHGVFANFAPRSTFYFNGLGLWVVARYPVNKLLYGIASLIGIEMIESMLISASRYL
jgi:hypothetical protein